MNDKDLPIATNDVEDRLVDPTSSFSGCGFSIAMYPSIDQAPSIMSGFPFMQSEIADNKTPITHSPAETVQPDPSYQSLNDSGSWAPFTSPGYLDMASTGLGSDFSFDYQTQLPDSLDSDSLDLTTVDPIQDTQVVDTSDEQNPKGNLYHKRARRFKCKWEGCPSQPSFNRDVDLLRHVKTIHICPRSYACYISGCHKLFNRKDNLMEHIKNYHNKGKS